MYRIRSLERTDFTFTLNFSFRERCIKIQSLSGEFNSAMIREKGNHTLPTHILYDANLSYTLLEGYLGDLIDKSLITESMEEGKKDYSLTQKGILFLERFKAVEEFYEIFDL